ncbi:MAG: hemolysin family protein [Chloroflexota bacterium]
MLIALLLSIANGLFSMSEIVIVSARKARLQARAQSGDAGAKKALSLSEDPEDVLSTVQIFITLISIVAGLLASDAILNDLNRVIGNLTLPEIVTQRVIPILVVVIITYFQLVIGELVPKRIGLNSPESIAARVALPMHWLSIATMPFVSFLNASSNGILALLRVKPSNEPAVTIEEVQIMMEAGADSGLFDPVKEEMMEQVLTLGSLRVNDLMVPRPDIISLDLQAPEDVLRTIIQQTKYERYPVVEGDEDNVVGIVFSRDILGQQLQGRPFELQALLREPLILPEGIPVLDLLNKFKAEQMQMALVIDEYGEVQGLMTFNDLLEAIVGDVPEQGDAPDPQIVRRADGSWLVDGRYPIETIKPQLSIGQFPSEEENYFHTIGGFMLHFLGRVPIASDHFQWGNYRFEVVDMDGRRVDKVMISAIQESSNE